MGCSIKTLNYTPQNNLRTTQWTFPYVVYMYLVSYEAQNRQDIEKIVFCPFKGSQNKVFPIKIWHLNFHFYPFPNLQFLPNLKKKKKNILV